MPGRFIALEGPDGVGKTTLAASLADITYEIALSRSTDNADSDPRARPLVLVPRRQISKTSTYSARVMQQLANVLWHSGDSPDLPDTFWIAMQNAWFTAHATTVVEPVLSAGFDVLVDGWVYKFLSKLLLQGHQQTTIDAIFGHVRMPDAVLLLSADVGALYDRRQAEFRPAELGMHAGYATLNRDTFIDYQQRGLDHLHAFAHQHGWPTIQLDTSTSVADNSARLLPMLERLRNPATTLGGLS